MQEWAHLDSCSYKASVVTQENQTSEHSAYALTSQMHALILYLHTL